MSKVIDMVEEHITKAVAELGYEIIEITYKKYLGDMNLTIFIDKDGGVDLNGCELVHRTIDPILDEIDPTSGEKYILNVSSWIPADFCTFHLNDSVQLFEQSSMRMYSCFSPE